MTAQARLLVHLADVVNQLLREKTGAGVSRHVDPQEHIATTNGLVDEVAKELLNDIRSSFRAELLSRGTSAADVQEPHPWDTWDGSTPRPVVLLPAGDLSVEHLAKIICEGQALTKQDCIERDPLLEPGSPDATVSITGIPSPEKCAAVIGQLMADNLSTNDVTAPEVS